MREMMMEEEEEENGRAGSPPRIENDALSQLKIENIWSESTEEEEAGPFSTCSISVDPALFLDDAGPEADSEEPGSPGGSAGSPPEVVLIPQKHRQGAPPVSPGPSERVESGEDDDDDQDDPLSTDHLQVEVIEIDSSDGAEEWSADSKKGKREKKGQSCNGKAGRGDEEEKKVVDGSEVDENSNSEWDFYSYLANMDGDGEEAGADGGAKRYVCYDCGFRTNRSDRFSTHVRTAHNDDYSSRKDDTEDPDEEEDDMGMEEGGQGRRQEWEEREGAPRLRHGRGGRGGGPSTAGPPVLKCGQCPFATRHRPLLTRHLRQAHGAAPGPSAPAPPPGGTQGAPGEVKYHHCDRCPYKTKWKHHIKEHYMFHHNEGEIEWHKCPLCDYQTKWKYHIKQHLKAKHADGREAATFSCPVPGCRFQTKWKPHFQRHLRQEHGTGGPGVQAGAPAAGAASVRLLACPHCPYSTPNRSNLNTHVRSQHGGGVGAQGTQGAQPEVHQCDKCGFRTRWKHHLKNHWIMKHQENAVLPVFRCGECSYESKWKHHVKIHRENKHTQLPCERCPFVAHTKLEMRQHVKTCHHRPPGGPRIVSVEGGASALGPAAAATTWAPAAAPGLRCRLCGHAAPHRAALEHHARLRHPPGAHALALQIPVLLRLPGPHGAALQPAAARPFHAAGLAGLGARALNAMGAPGGALANGARMQLPVLLRLPADGGAPGAQAGLDLQSCFRMMSSLYGAPVAPGPPGRAAPASASSGGGQREEAPIVLLRCSDCAFQTASVEALKLHVASRHGRRGAGPQNGAEDEEGDGGGEAQCTVCGAACAGLEALVRHSRDRHGRTLVVNGSSVSLLPPEISVTPVQPAPRPQR